MAFHLGEQLGTRSRILTGRVPTGSSISLLSTDRQHRHIYFHTIYEPAVTALIRRRLLAGQKMYDVGANAGYFTLLALDLGATVHAFEPNPRVRALLARSLALRGESNARLASSACGDTSGFATLYLSDDTNTGMTSLQRRSPNEIAVELTTLTAHWHETGLTPDLIKIDVEGHELAVIRGSRELLQAVHPDLIVEVTDARTVTMLTELGYHTHGIAGDGRPDPVDPSSVDLAEGYANLYFTIKPSTDLVGES